MILNLSVSRLGLATVSSSLAHVLLLAMLVAGASAQQWLVGNGLLTFDSRWSNEAFVEVAAGQYHGLARRADGTVVAFGRNDRGQCDVPALPSGITYVAMSAGGAHSAALRSDGQIVVWGDNSEGQHAVPALPGGTTWVQVASGHYHLVGLRSDGLVQCWGRSLFGLHNVPVLDPGHVVVQVAAGANHCLWLRDDGEVAGWGENSAGQANVPSPPPGYVYTFVAAGQDHSVGIFNGGAGWAWGANNHGQSNMPPLPPGVGYVSAVCGFHHSVARRSDGSLVAWGLNDKQQLQLPTLPVGLSYTQAAAFGLQTLLLRSDGRLVTWGEYQALPPQLPAGVAYVSASCRHQHALALRSDGRVVAWGLDDFGQCSGIPTLPLGMSYVAIGTGARHSIALRNDGVLVGWGDNSLGQYSLYGTGNIAEISVGSYFTVARATSGAVFSCGYNGDGQLGVVALPSFHFYTQIAAGGAHVLAGRSDGDVVGWGRNAENELGLGSLLPQAVVNISAGNFHSAAVRSDGTLLASGDNSSGQCTVPAYQDFVDVAAGDAFTLGLRSDGTLLAWGTNANHELAVQQAPPGFEVASMAAGQSRAIVAYRPKSTEVVVRRSWPSAVHTYFHDRNQDGRDELAAEANGALYWDARGDRASALVTISGGGPGPSEAAAFGNLGTGGSAADSVRVGASGISFLRSGLASVDFTNFGSLPHVVLSDVDGNGWVDAVVAMAGSPPFTTGGVGIYFNPWDTSHPMMGLVAQPGGVGAVRRVHAADLDGDGDQDVVALSRGNPDRIQLYANSGTGAQPLVLADTIVLGASNEVTDLELVDLDEDGSLDLVVSAPGLLTGANRLFVLARSGPGLAATSYSTATVALPGGHASELAVGNVLPDGTGPDLVCNDLLHGGAFVLHDYQAGSFTTIEPRLAGIVANTLEVGDCNGDGIDDLGFGWHARSTYGVSLTVPQASLHPYGTGCAGIAGVPILGANGLPRSGSATFRLTVAQARPNSVALLFGAFGPASIPLLPSGCTVLLDDLISLGFTLTSSAGTGSLPMPLPPGFGGVSLYFQAAVLDVDGAYENFASFTNGLRTQLGN